MSLEHASQAILAASQWTMPFSETSQAEEASNDCRNVSSRSAEPGRGQVSKVQLDADSYGEVRDSEEGRKHAKPWPLSSSEHCFYPKNTLQHKEAFRGGGGSILILIFFSYVKLGESV